MNIYLGKNHTLVAVLLLLFTLVAVVIGATITSTQVVKNFDQQAYQSYLNNQLTSLNDLALSFEAQQSTYLPLSPPAPDFKLTQDSGITCFDPKGFPANFVKSLIPRFIDGATTYPITVTEDPKTRSRVVLNASGIIVATIPAPYGYDPRWMTLEMYPSLRTSTADMLALYDPSRIAISFSLIDQKNLVNYLLKQSADVAVTQAAVTSPDTQAQTLALGGTQLIGMKMMFVPPVTNITIAGISYVTNGVKITIGYPGGYTNKLDIITSSDLMTFWWTFVATVNTDPSTNAIEWVDTNALPTLQFYRAGNGDKDTDGDGLTDFREKHLYHSNPTLTNSDGDAYSDYYEVMTLNTDPSDPCTTVPNAGITSPTNNFNSLWMP